MANFNFNLILIGFTLICSLGKLGGADEAETSVVTNDLSEECEGKEGCDGHFSAKLQTNYLDGFLQIQKFFQSTNLVLEQINKKLGLFEQTIRLQDVVQIKLHPEYENLKIGAYLETLSPPVQGLSFKGSTIESIAAAVPGIYALAVQFVNYLDVNLKDYQLHLPRGSEHQKAPITVQPKTREIFTFKRIPNDSIPRGVLLYKMGDSRISLHLFFDSYGRYAFGLLGNKATKETLWPIDVGCSNYNHKGSRSSFECIEYDESNLYTTKTFLVTQDSVYAKMTINFGRKTQILKIEIFKFDS